MSSRPSVRVCGAIAGSALAATLLVMPVAAATAAPLAATTAASECEVTGGTLNWGVKESFRSYISGSIANGSWEASDGVTYETPQFTWSGATGTIDPATGTGSVSFTGTVHFTGHDGVLDLTFANPTIEFEGPGKAALLLDAKSTDMEGEVTVDSAQEWLGEVVAPATLTPQNDALRLDGLAATLTNSGAAAFAGFYEAGADLDAVDLDLELASCAAAVAATETPAATEPAEEPTTAPEEEASVPWLPIIIGGVAVVVIAVTTGILIGGRKRKPSEAAAGEPAETPTPEA